MGHPIGGCEPSDAPARRCEGTLVLKVHAPGIGAIEVVLQAGAQDLPLRARIPHRIEVAHVVPHPEPVEQHQRLQRPVASPFLEEPEPDVERVPELLEPGAAGIEQIDAVHPGKPGPHEAGPERDAGAGQSLADHPKGVLVAVRVLPWRYGRQRRRHRSGVERSERRRGIEHDVSISRWPAGVDLLQCERQPAEPLA